MNKKEFDIKYKKQGGIYELTKMMVSLANLKDISSHFGVSRERVRQWTVQFFGKKYDPRKARREIIIIEIVKSIKKFGMVETSKIYKNKDYINQALKSLKNGK